LLIYFLYLILVTIYIIYWFSNYFINCEIIQTLLLHLTHNYTAISLGCFPDPGYRMCFGHYEGHQFHIRNYVMIMSRYNSNLTP